MLFEIVWLYFFIVLLVDFWFDERQWKVALFFYAMVWICISYNWMSIPITYLFRGSHQTRTDVVDRNNVSHVTLLFMFKIHSILTTLVQNVQNLHYRKYFVMEIYKKFCDFDVNFGKTYNHSLVILLVEQTEIYVQL